MIQITQEINRNEIWEKVFISQHDVDYITEYQQLPDRLLATFCNKPNTLFLCGLNYPQGFCYLVFTAQYQWGAITRSIAAHIVIAHGYIDQDILAPLYLEKAFKATMEYYGIRNMDGLRPTDGFRAILGLINRAFSPTPNLVKERANDGEIQKFFNYLNAKIR